MILEEFIIKTCIYVMAFQYPYATSSVTNVQKKMTIFLVSMGILLLRSVAMLLLINLRQPMLTSVILCQKQLLIDPSFFVLLSVLSIFTYILSSIRVPRNMSYSCPFCCPIFWDYNGDSSTGPVAMTLIGFLRAVCSYTNLYRPHNPFFLKRTSYQI